MVMVVKDLWITVCTAFLFPIVIVAAPQKVPPASALDFMKKYGYLDRDDGNTAALYTEDGISDALKTLQKFGAIPETGRLDNATLQLMSSKRCGVPDILKNKRSKRFVIASDGWNKRHISYFLANWSPRLGEQTVDRLIRKALDTWGSYGHLSFQRKATPDADIIVLFGSGEHGDQFPFDGPGTVLAHAYFPNDGSEIAGDIHFDNDESWIDLQSDRDAEGTDFYAVALHELGHSLGLAHSSDPNSVMFPYYSADAGSEYQLGHDDIMAMYQLYILRNIKDQQYDYPTESTIAPTRRTRPTTSSTKYTRPTTAKKYPTPQFTTSTATTSTRSTTRYTTQKPTTPTKYTVLYEGDYESVEVHKRHEYPPEGKPFYPNRDIPTRHTEKPKEHGPSTTSPPGPPDICLGKFDAIAKLRNELFVFKNQYIWRLQDKGNIMPGYPIMLWQMFPDLPKSINNIDAAYEREDGSIVLFTGKLFWVFDGSRFIENSPRFLTEYKLPAELDSIDAIQIWSQNRKTYIFKDHLFWRYNALSDQMDPGYPKHIDRWGGIPPKLDTALTWRDGFTYFFKDELFWKIDNNFVRVTEESPMPSTQIWLGCPETEYSIRRLN